MKKIAFITVLCAFVAVPAFADFTPVGEPVEGNSWTQRFYSEAYAMDHFQMKMLTPDVLRAPTFTWFGVGGWSETYNDGEIAIAEGPRVVGRLYFDLTFNDPKSNSFTFYLQGYDGTSLNAIDDNWITWTGSGWLIGAPSGWNTGLIAPVPAGVLLGMLGLSVAGLKLRKFA